MMRQRAKVLFLAVILALSASQAIPAAERSSSPEQVNLIVLLPPPPRVGSTQADTEVAEIVEIQKNLTPAEAASAVSDNRLSVFQLASGVFGPKFTPENCPLAGAFFERLGKSGAPPIRAVKSFWGKQRPFLASREVKACVDDATGGSYPSGHSTFSYFTAIVLSDMVPEKKAELFDRAAQYARNRMVCGVHYRSDVEAGRAAGTVFAAFAMQNPDFEREFSEVRKEVRKVLGYE